MQAAWRLQQLGLHPRSLRLSCRHDRVAGGELGAVLHRHLRGDLRTLLRVRWRRDRRDYRGSGLGVPVEHDLRPLEQLAAGRGRGAESGGVRQLVRRLRVLQVGGPSPLRRDRQLTLAGEPCGHSRTACEGGRRWSPRGQRPADRRVVQRLLESGAERVPLREHLRAGLVQRGRLTRAGDDRRCRRPAGDRRVKHHDGRQELRARHVRPHHPGRGAFDGVQGRECELRSGGGVCSPRSAARAGMCPGVRRGKLRRR